MGHLGTAQKCDCCGKKTVAFGENGTLEIKARHHGTNHVKSYTVAALVKLLDPQGTFCRIIGTTS